MQKVLLTADDYGMCPEVDEAIEKLAEYGTLSTTNVLTNFNTDFTNSPLKNKENFSIGIHWNVTTGRPVTDPQKIPTLVKENGDFYSIDEFRYRYRKGLIDAKDLRTELLNQYDIYYKYFGVPEYWNSHENSALYPKEFKVVESVALEKGIKCTRNFQRVYIDYENCVGFKRKLREFIVKTFVDYWFGVRVKRKFTMPSGRIITFKNITKTNPDKLRRALENTKKPSVEIVIHPAIRGDNPLFGNIGQDRVVEYNSFMSQEFYDILENENRTIVSFEKL